MAIDLNLTGEGLAAVIVAVGTLPLGAYQTWRAIRADRKADAQVAALTLVAAKQDDTHTALTAVVETVSKMGENVALVEKNTNSLKDALVASTAKASHQEGVQDGMAQEKARATSKPKTGNP